MRLVSYEGNASQLAVPAEHDGIPVRSIGSHALEEHQELREIYLPETIREIRSFAMYSCVNLRTVSLYDKAEDYYDGVIRGCTSLRKIEIRSGGKSYALMRQMLQDVDNMLRFHLIFSDHEVWLTFPEYVSEAHEDTMARAIHFSIEGAGIAYRECVHKREIDYAEYDSLFDRLTDYDFDAAADIALDRLTTPEELGAKARETYTAFLRQNAERALLHLIKAKDADRVRYICENHLADPDAVRAVLQAASAEGDAQICGILMQGLSDEGKSEEGTSSAFTLDDW